MNEEMNQFLDQVKDLFFRLGIKSVTMADIARELGISKKTIYNKVEDKDELVSQVLERELELDKCRAEEIFQEDKNAIDEVFDICSMMAEMFSKMHPSVIFDLQKYYPHHFKKFQEYNRSTVLNAVIGNLIKGKNQGFYRLEFNEEIIARIYISKMDVIFDHQLFDPKNYTLIEVVNSVIIYHLHGIANEKGLKYLKNKMTELKIKL